MDNKYSMIKTVQSIKDEREKREKVESRSRTKLESIISKRIRTTMIGALAAIEKQLGIDPKNPTANDKELNEAYQAIRSEILDNGNNQIRNLSDDLENFSVNERKYFIELKFEQ